MNRFMLVLLVGVFLLSFGACTKEMAVVSPESSLKIRGVDASYLPEVRQSGLTFFNANQEAEDMLLTLKKAGVNVIRLRLWNDPQTPTSNLATVAALSNEIKALGMEVMLSVHYSDTWADPGSQTKPMAWQNLTFEQLKDSVSQYTALVVKTIKPNYIQLGNEINGGLLWPDGRYDNIPQMVALLDAASVAVRQNSSTAKIVVQVAGIEQAPWFFDQIKSLDYDIMALSYYVHWHGKSLDSLEQTMNALVNKHGKDIVIAETAYPFTFSWNDATNNIVGTQNQILEAFPANPGGQKAYLLALKERCLRIPRALGFVYWGAEWVSYQGSSAINGSPWENQALWRFNNVALPAMDAFR